MAWVIKRGDEIEIGEIKAEKGGGWSGDDTVEKELGSGKVSCWGVCFPFIVHKVATNGEADTEWVSFLGAVIGADAQISLASFLVVVGGDG